MSSRDRAEPRIRRRRGVAIIACTCLVLATLVAVSAFTGIATITPAGLWRYLCGDRGPDALTDRQWVSFSTIRLLRIVMGIAVGALLAIAGALMQCITSNAMASPFTTGVSSAAAFGASVAIALRLRLFGSFDAGMILCAFLAALVCSAVSFGLAAVRSLGKNAIILTGIALSYLFGALHNSLQFIATEQSLSSMVGWTFGSLTRASWAQALLLVAMLGAMTVMVLVLGRSYTVLELGDETATAMGVDVWRLRLSTGLVVTIVAATVVSFSGVIGFVGLVGPHIAHLLIGSHRRWQVPLAGLVGAVLVVGADLLGRTVLSPAEIPVGIVVSLVGVPLFVWLIVHSHREG